jgi:hypothetical protein
MVGSRESCLCVLLVGLALPVHGQRPATLPGAWPLTGAAGTDAGAPAPLPDRSVELPRDEPGRIVPGVDVSAGFLYDGRDPTALHDSEQVRPSDRALPREANDQPRAVPGVSITVPLGR